ncbi:unnamed protein product, partial [Ectocarpus sp. 12 AP-2014]
MSSSRIRCRGLPLRQIQKLIPGSGRLGEMSADVANDTTGGSSTTTWSCCTYVPKREPSSVGELRALHPTTSTALSAASNRLHRGWWPSSRSMASARRASAIANFSTDFRNFLLLLPLPLRWLRR